MKKLEIVSKACGVVAFVSAGKTYKRKLVNECFKFNKVKYWVYGDNKVVVASKYYVLARIDTKDWDADFLTKNNIEKTRTVYLFDSSEVTCLCSPVPCYNMIPVYGLVEFTAEMYDDCNEGLKEECHENFDNEWALATMDRRNSDEYWTCKDVFTYELVPVDCDDLDDIIDGLVSNPPIC